MQANHKKNTQKICVLTVENVDPAYGCIIPEAQRRIGTRMREASAAAVADASGGSRTEAFCSPRYLAGSRLFVIRCIRRSVVIVCK